VVDLEDIARGEFAENVQRKDFTPSEVAAIAKALEPKEREAARERQAHDGPRSGKLPERSTGRTRDKVAAYVGRFPLTVSARALGPNEREAARERQAATRGGYRQSADREWW
jgi:hypothetical protein